MTSSSSSSPDPLAQPNPSSNEDTDAFIPDEGLSFAFDTTLLPVWRAQVADETVPLDDRLTTLQQVLLYDDSDEAAVWLSHLIGAPSVDMAVRCAAALGLAKFSSQEAMTLLLAHRNEPDPFVRRYVIEAMASTAKLDVLEALINALHDSDNHVFSTAAQGLGQLGRPASPVMCQTLADKNQPPDVRCIIAWQLGEMGAVEALPTLVEQARSADNLEIQALCVWAMGQIGEGPPEVMAVLQWGKVQPAPEIRLRAETALKKIVRHLN
jgi:HEAT repeat protein